jgi:hypothetical protein
VTFPPANHHIRHPTRNAFRRNAAMRPPEVKAAALELVAQGLNDCEISRRLGFRAAPSLTGAGQPTCH